mgnify:CR=1 FL=1
MVWSTDRNTLVVTNWVFKSRKAVVQFTVLLLMIKLCLNQNSLTFVDLES